MNTCDQCGGFGHWAEKPTLTICPACYGTGYPQGEALNMTLSEYQKLALRSECSKNTAKTLFNGDPGCDSHWMQVFTSDASNRLRAESTDLVARLSHGVIGLSGEVGELNTALQKLLYYGRPLSNDVLANFIEECGDALWYLALIANALGLDLDNIATYNLRKLRVRYPMFFRDIEERDKEAELKDVFNAAE